MRKRDARLLAVAYGLALVGLVALAVLTWDRYGQILLILAVLLALIAPLRREPEAFLPLAIGSVVLALAYLLIAPANCTTGAIGRVGGDQVPGRFCESLAGIDYEREGTADPSAFPAFGASLAAGLVVAGGVRAVVRRRMGLDE